jgi:hypothetical protein
MPPTAHDIINLHDFVNMCYVTNMLPFPRMGRFITFPCLRSLKPSE